VTRFYKQLKKSCHVFAIVTRFTPTPRACFSGLVKSCHVLVNRDTFLAFFQHLQFFLFFALYHAQNNYELQYSSENYFLQNLQLFMLFLLLKLPCELQNVMKMTLKIANNWLSSQPQTWTIPCPQGIFLQYWQSTVK